jgi:hypothetical protein
MNCAVMTTAVAATIMVALMHSAAEWQYLIHHNSLSIPQFSSAKISSSSSSSAAAAAAFHHQEHQQQFSQNIINDHPPSSSSDYGYSVLIISYHKTGHDLQMDLVDYIANEFNDIGMDAARASLPHLTKYGNKSPLARRRHRPNFKCSKIHLQTGTISVQHA